MLPVIIATFLFIGLAVLLLSIGVLFKKKSLQGSCGAASKLATMNGVEISCDNCSVGKNNPDCEKNQEAGISSP